MKKNDFFEKNKLFLAIIIGAFIIGLFILAGLLINSKTPNKDSHLSSDKKTKTQNPTDGNEIEPLSNPTNPNKLDVYYDKVSKVVDGDTIILSNNETIRFIGINAEEKGQKC